MPSPLRSSHTKSPTETGSKAPRSRVRSAIAPETRNGVGAVRPVVGSASESTVVAHVGEGRDEPGRERAEIELDEVHARCEIGEVVEAAAVGGGRGDLDRITRDRIDEEERDVDAGNAGLADVLHTVTVDVFEDEVADGNRHEDAHVERQVGRPRRTRGTASGRSGP